MMLALYSMSSRGFAWTCYKMFKRSYFAIFVFVTYLVLIVLFFSTREKKYPNDVCNYGDICVRFCCSDEKLCTEKYIRTNFNDSKIPRYEKEDQEIKIFYGKPYCPLPLTLLEPAIYQFTGVISKYSVFELL